MGAVERKGRWDKNSAWVRQNTSAKWGRSFLEGLAGTVKEAGMGMAKGKGKAGPKREGSDSDGPV